MARFSAESLKLFFLLIPIPVIWVVLVHFEVLAGLENIATDWRFQVRGELPDPLPIYYVEIDGAFLEAYGERPWNRALFAGSAAAMLEVGQAKAVFFDIVLSKVTASQMVPKELLVQGDEVLGQVVRAYGIKILLGASYSGIKMEHMDRPAVFPMVETGGYNPSINPYPETPTYPVVDPNWGRAVLVNTALAENHGATPRWVPMFAETEGPVHMRNFAIGMVDHLDLPRQIEVEGRDEPVPNPRETENSIEVLDTDLSVIRSLPRNTARDFYAAGLELAALYYDLIPEVAITRSEDGNSLELRDFDENLVTRIPVTKKQLVEVNWFNSYYSEANKRVSLSAVLAGLEIIRNPDSDPADQEKALDFFADFKDHVVLVGAQDYLLQDVAPTPFDSVDVPKMGMHGNLLRTIVSGEYITRVPFWLHAVILLLLALFVAGLASYSGKASLFVKGLGVAVLVAYIVASFFVFAQYHFVLPLVAPVGAAVTTGFTALLVKLLVEEQQRGRIKGMFGTYVSPELVNRMIDSGEEPTLGGIDSEITAFFSDIQSFSSFSEVLRPDQLVDLINEYLGDFTTILEERGGTLDKYIGDAIVAMYGAPVELEDHAYRACMASQLMQRRQAELREKWRSEEGKWPEIVHQMRTRIGLNTGMATVGNMGSSMRFNYTMMGDTVNLAARLESGAKSYGVYTLVSEETKDACERVGNECVFRFIDRIVVKGRTKPVGIYEIMGLRDELPADAMNCLELFDQAIEAYLRQDWDRAIALFRQAEELEPGHPDRNPGIPTCPSIVLAKRSAEMKENPPGDDWDGVYVMTTK